MDVVFFKSFLRKNFAEATKTQRGKAAVSAAMNTEEQLQRYCHVAETRLVRASDREELIAAARQDLDEYKMALAAKSAWDRLGPYKKQYPFRPCETGDNLDKLPQLLKLREIIDVGCDGLSPKEVREKYGPWKKKYDKFIRRHEKASEKELQTKFSEFLEFFNIEVGDVRQFYKLETYDREGRTSGTYEGDILLEPVGKEDFSFVEIKAIYKIDKKIQKVLKAALYQAALYVVLACIMRLPKSPENAPQATRHYKRRVAAIGLPMLVSRFGVVEFDLDEKGNITNFTIAAG
ncbi:MAG: uncharacterized protein A8A55_3365, partial [Amphiamblys sp. WSBS2006]